MTDKEIKNKIRSCRHSKVCKSTKKGTWVDCQLGKGLVCNPEANYCKYEIYVPKPIAQDKEIKECVNCGLSLIDGEEEKGLCQICDLEQQLLATQKKLGVTEGCLFQMQEAAKDLQQKLDEAKAEIISLTEIKDFESDMRVKAEAENKLMKEALEYISTFEKIEGDRCFDWVHLKSKAKTTLEEINGGKDV